MSYKIYKLLLVTLKKFRVLPPRFAPNSTGHLKSGFPQSFNSSALLITDVKDSTVKKAAKLAVYDETIINVKNHQIAATALVDVALFKLLCILN